MRWLSGDGPKWEEAVAGLVLAVVFLSVVWGVIARYIAPQPAVWSNELATIGFAWLIFLGAAAGAKRGLHVGVDLVTARLPKKVQRWLAAGVNLFLALALAYIVFLSIKIGLASLDRPTPVLRLPTTVIHAAVAIGFASIAAGSVLRAIRLIAGPS